VLRSPAFVPFVARRGGWERPPAIERGAVSREPRSSGHLRARRFAPASRRPRSGRRSSSRSGDSGDSDSDGPEDLAPVRALLGTHTDAQRVVVAPRSRELV
jgi:hypothetical protein